MKILPFYAYFSRSEAQNYEHGRVTGARYQGPGPSFDLTTPPRAHRLRKAIYILKSRSSNKAGRGFTASSRTVGGFSFSHLCVSSEKQRCCRDSRPPADPWPTPVSLGFSGRRPNPQILDSCNSSLWPLEDVHVSSRVSSIWDLRFRVI